MRASEVERWVTAWAVAGAGSHHLLKPAPFHSSLYFLFVQKLFVHCRVRAQVGSETPGFLDCQGPPVESGSLVFVRMLLHSQQTTAVACGSSIACLGWGRTASLTHVPDTD